MYLLYVFIIILVYFLSVSFMKGSGGLGFTAVPSTWNSNRYTVDKQ